MRSGSVSASLHRGFAVSEFCLQMKEKLVPDFYQILQNRDVKRKRFFQWPLKKKKTEGLILSHRDQIFV